MWAECRILNVQPGGTYVQQIAAFKMLELVFISKIRIFHGEKWRINDFWDGTLSGWAIVTSQKTWIHIGILNTQRGITVEASTKYSCKTMASDFIRYRTKMKFT
jgi:hypothetical protein